MGLTFIHALSRPVNQMGVKFTLFGHAQSLLAAEMAGYQCTGMAPTMSSS